MLISIRCSTDSATGAIIPPPEWAFVELQGALNAKIPAADINALIKTGKRK
jgi:hypothetical protein